MIERLRAFLWATPRGRFAACFLAIAAANLWAHSPALQHPPRGDQWGYWIDARDADGAWEHIRDFSSYMRVHRIQPGDENRYLPLSYVLIGVQKALFGADFPKWQAVSILLHLGVCFWLLRLLWSVRPGLLAFGFVLWFSTLHSGMEMVVWHHVCGYSLFVNFSLAAVYYMHRYLTEEGSGNRRLCLALLAATLAAFTAETGILFCGIFALALLACDRSRRWRAVWFSLPVVLFYTANILDYRSQGLGDAPRTDVRLVPESLSTAWRDLKLLVQWALANSLFPAQFHLSHKRMHMPLTDFADAFARIEGRFWLYCLAALSGFYFWTRPLRGILSALRAHGRLAGLLSLMLAAVCYSIVVGRMQTRGIHVVTTNAHYCYFLMVFVTALFFLAA